MRIRNYFDSAPLGYGWTLGCYMFGEKSFDKSEIFEHQKMRPLNYLTCIANNSVNIRCSYMANFVPVLCGSALCLAGEAACNEQNNKSSKQKISLLNACGCDILTNALLH